jgi:hypothetical protein
MGRPLYLLLSLFFRRLGAQFCEDLAQSTAVPKSALYKTSSEEKCYFTLNVNVPHAQVNTQSSGAPIAHLAGTCALSPRPP